MRCSKSLCLGTASTFLCCTWRSSPSSWTSYSGLSLEATHTAEAFQSSRASITSHAICGGQHCLQQVQSLKSGMIDRIFPFWRRKPSYHDEYCLTTKWTLGQRSLLRWRGRSARAPKQRWKGTWRCQILGDDADSSMTCYSLSRCWYGVTITNFRWSKCLSDRELVISYCICTQERMSIFV